MGIMPLYKTTDHPRKQLNTHKGLWFERFFDKYDRQWQVPDGDKKTWIDVVTDSCGDKTSLEKANERQKRLCFSLSGQAKVFKAEWHFTTGLGNAHPVENGFAWHPTLGTPYLSGASVKGLIRAYIEAWSGLEEDEISEICRFWFGSESKNPKKQDKDNPSPAGAYIFFDAIPIAPVTLACDTMTPHMGDWYAKGDKIENVTMNSDSLPADWHNPVPIPFLVVKEGSFLFSIAPRNPQDTNAQEQLPLVLQALEYALEYMGAGAKTATGYGRMMDDVPANKAIEKERKDAERSEMPAKERFRQEFQEMDDKKIAEMFGKGFNKTQESAGSDWELKLEALLEVKGDLIHSWETAGKNTSEEKAYKKLKGTGKLIQ